MSIDPSQYQMEMICTRLMDEISRLGFAAEALQHLPLSGRGRLSLEKDPYSGDITHCLTWKNDYGHRLGEIKCHGDGSFYAEYDVALPHPTDRNWFVEAVVVWGKGDQIKGEPRLLAALGE